MCDALSYDTRQYVMRLTMATQAKALTPRALRNVSMCNHAWRHCVLSLPKTTTTKKPLYHAVMASYARHALRRKVTMFMQGVFRPLLQTLTMSPYTHVHELWSLTKPFCRVAELETYDKVHYFPWHIQWRTECECAEPHNNTGQGRRWYRAATSVLLALALDGRYNRLYHKLRDAYDMYYSGSTLLI